MRKGVALLITITVIATLLALIGVSFSYLERAKKDSSNTASIIQANIFYKDISKTLITLLKGKNSQDVISTLYLAPQTIAEQDGDFFLTIGCEPLSNGVNINWLGLGNDKKNLKKYELATTLFDEVVSKYDVEDSQTLLQFIIEDIEGKSKYRRLKQKSGIVSKSQFDMILKRYFAESSDMKVFSIPWRNYFSFLPKDSLIDSNYLSAEFISLIFNLDLISVQEEWIAGEDLSKFLQDRGVDMTLYDKKIFSSTTLKFMECSSSYNYDGKIYKFSFNYLDGRVGYFEFYGEQ
ncbi:hypothetical protein MNB_SV-15-167 [hydrothermal vent metagenome]|uniref:General secretion pathway protein K n=1 Tax=hydrothermal vent metagenome TaxID=652676 RepID=A0A1W1EL74_9ZZZZ